MSEEGPGPVEVETKPTKAIVGGIGALCTGLLATISGDGQADVVFLGWTGIEIAASVLGGALAALAVYGFRNAPKD